jgi:hypothetical protein
LDLLSPLELVLFLDELKERESLTPSHEMNLLKVVMHSVNFCMSWKISGGFILVIADTTAGDHIPE